MIFKVLFAITFFAVYASCQKLNNHIIQFASTEARDRYVRNLQNINPYVQVSNIDTVFIGVVTSHSNIDSFEIESEMLTGFHSSGDYSITSFEQDQIVDATRYIQRNAPWHLDRINRRSLPLQNSFLFDKPSQSVNIYIVDSGVKISHQDFGGRARAAYSADSNYPAGNDCSGHGTHVAGIAGGTTYGVCKNARIWDVRVLNCKGSGSNSGIIKALDWVARNAIKPAVVNMSLGGGKSTALNNAVNGVSNSGVTVVVAAGNSGDDACKYSPSSASLALTVGSSTKSDSRSSFSNYGSCVKIYAPGSNIVSAGTSSNSSTTTKSGTSMASPVVTGVVARLLQSNPSYSPNQVKNQIISQATKSVSSSINPLVYQS